MLKTIFATALLVAASVPARATVVTGFEEDEIEGTKTYLVEIRSQDYKPITQEDAIRFSCSPRGAISLIWWRGGRHAGTAWTGDVTYRIDDEQPRQANLNPFPSSIKENAIDARQFIRELSAGNVLIIKATFETVTARYTLAGSAAAFRPFMQQCAQEKPGPAEKMPDFNARRLQGK